MSFKFDWIPEPEWSSIDATDEEIKFLTRVVEQATGITLNENQEILIEQKLMPYFEGAFAGGLTQVGTLVNALRDNKIIRVRFRRS